MKNLKIYLAGKMSGLTFEEMNSWRKELKSWIMHFGEIAGYNENNLQVINPTDFFNFEEKRHQSEKEVMDYDLSHVISSDIVVVNLEGLDTSDGTKIEIYEANQNHKIPVIAFGDKELYENLHPWHKESITRVENRIMDVVDYIQDFYFI